MIDDEGEVAERSVYHGQLIDEHWLSDFLPTKHGWTIWLAECDTSDAKLENDRLQALSHGALRR